jgi:hypothetical protein
MGIRGPLLQLDLDGRGTAGPFRRARTAAQPWLALGLLPTWLVHRVGSTSGSRVVGACV